MDIILISRKNNRRLNLHLKSVFAILAGLALIVILAVFAYNAAIFTSHKVDQKRWANLYKDNKIVREEITRIEKEFMALNTLIDSLELYDKKLRTYASLRPISDDVRKMGVGGSGRYDDAKELPTDVRNNLSHLSTNLDNLLARSKFQKESFNMLLTHLEERQFLRNHTPSIVPVQGWFMSGFGYRIDPFTGRVKMHEGLDIAAPPGTPICAPADGTVRYVGVRKGFGLTLEINHGHGFVTLYAHCQRIKVKRGENVRRGDIIAYVGSTGKSTGPHLHYEIRISQVPVNPINYVLTASSVFD